MAVRTGAAAAGVRALARLLPGRIHPRHRHFDVRRGAARPRPQHPRAHFAADRRAGPLRWRSGTSSDRSVSARLGWLKLGAYKCGMLLGRGWRLTRRCPTLPRRRRTRPSGCGRPSRISAWPVRPCAPLPRTWTSLPTAARWPRGSRAVGFWCWRRGARRWISRLRRGAGAQR